MVPLGVRVRDLITAHWVRLPVLSSLMLLIGERRGLWVPHFSLLKVEIWAPCFVGPMGFEMLVFLWCLARVELL